MHHPWSPTARGAIRLPNTCPENRRSFTFVRLLTEVQTDAWSGAGFEGQLYAPGTRLPAEDIGTHPVLLEFAGPQGTWARKKKRAYLWILWRYDWEIKDWMEVARATAHGWEWALILRGPAIRALAPREATMAPDPSTRGREVTEELLEAIDAALVLELSAVRALVLTSIYDRMAGRIVAAV